MTKSISLHISGMGCNACSQKIETALNALNGVEAAKVDLEKAEVEISYNSDLLTLEDLKFTIEKTGYQPSEKTPVVTMVVDIEGMSCEHCVKSVTSSINEVEGVREVSVSLSDGRAWISYEPTQSSPEDFNNAIRKAGFKVDDTESSGNQKKSLN